MVTGGWLDFGSLAEAFKLLFDIGPIQRDALVFAPLAEIIGNEVDVFAVAMLLGDLTPRLRIPDTASGRERIHGGFRRAFAPRFAARLGSIQLRLHGLDVGLHLPGYAHRIHMPPILDRGGFHCEPRQLVDFGNGGLESHLVKVVPRR